MLSQIPEIHHSVFDHSVFIQAPVIFEEIIALFQLLLIQAQAQKVRAVNGA